MAWPDSPATPSAYDQGTDDPSLARSQILDLHTKLSSVIANRGQPNGVCDLDANGAVPVARLQSLPYGLGGKNDFRSTPFSTGTPTDYFNKGARFGFANAADLGIPGFSGNSYGTLIVFGSWSDGAGGEGTSRMFVGGGNSQVFVQFRASDTAWGPWQELMTPEVLAAGGNVYTTSFTAAAIKSVSVGNGVDFPFAFTVVTVPAGKKLYLRRIWARTGSSLQPKIYTSSGQFTGDPTTDTDADTLLSDNSGGGSASTVVVNFEVHNPTGSPITATGYESISAYFQISG